MSKWRRLKRERPDGWTKGTTPEHWCCIDCGFNTAPAAPTRIEMEREFAERGRSGFGANAQSEIYHVYSWVWERAGMEPWGGCLCIGCLEARIGRPLTPDDFPDHPFNNVLPGTQRLLERQGRSIGDWESAA
jgi:hypothetical protein